jgi:hypothetical protein
VNLREVVNGVIYVLSTGYQWRYIPKDLPPRSTVDGYLCRWEGEGSLEKPMIWSTSDVAHGPSVSLARPPASLTVIA